ncbi:hypothetical protein AVEN_52389-1 [Araneus ventricosus]|uniref:Tc3 transposase DNA binding domain-containing protein n=1 Tax=Araneus ventricosus TaxID=182803 RepID=A0A4Y2L1J3_ARAVE|nr:hypothetical protein AVEN_52389-1 [Araneus ventricosus]
MSDKCIRSVSASAMAGYQDLSDFERGVIVGAREMGHSISEVAMEFGFSRTTISRVYREYRVSCKTSNFCHRCSWKKTLKELDHCRQTRILKRDRRATLSYIAADFNDGASTSGSVRTSQWTVINMESQSRRPTRVPLLTTRHKALHLSWALQHYHWTVDDWKHIAWSDESRFQLYWTDARVRQDNATPHASRVATKWLQEHSSDFRHFLWPPKSSETNIIEYIRDALLHAVENRSPPPRTPTDLWTVLKDEWCEFPPRHLQTLVESMPHRVAALLCVRGALHDIKASVPVFLALQCTTKRI